MYTENYIKQSIDVKNKLLADKKIINTIEQVAETITNAYKDGHKVLTAGNGGSTADAQHIAGELVGKFNIERDGLPSISLTNDMAIITAVGNDYSFEEIFARQIQANGKKGDVFIGISTSGNSKNIVRALEEAKKNNIVTVLLTGKNECLGERFADYTIKVPSDTTPFIQECHIMIGHILCAIVEKNLFS